MRLICEPWVGRLQETSSSPKGTKAAANGTKKDALPFNLQMLEDTPTQCKESFEFHSHYSQRRQKYQLSGSLIDKMNIESPLSSMLSAWILSGYSETHFLSKLIAAIIKE